MILGQTSRVVTFLLTARMIVANAASSRIAVQSTKPNV